LLDNNLKKGGNLSFTHLILVLVSVLAIISGILGHGIIFKIAVSGPLIISSLGVFLLIFTVEARHGLSQVIDSKITSVRGLETSFKEVRWKLELSYVLAGTLFFLISIVFLSNRIYSGFVLFLMLSSSMFAVTLGRHFGSSINTSDTMNSWDEFSQTDKNNEYQQLKQWLNGDANEKLSSIQEKNIERQKDIFLEYLKSELSNKSRLKLLLTSLEKADDLVEMLFTVTLKELYNEWLVDILSIQSKTGHYMVRNSLISLLLFPTINHLLSHMCEPKRGENSELLNKLLTETGKFAIQLNSLDILVDGGRSISGSVGVRNSSIDNELQRFIKFIALKSSMYPNYEFSPWWLLNIRTRLLSLNDLSEWADKELVTRLSPYSQQLKKHIEDWCFLLSEYFEGGQATGLSFDKTQLESTQWVSKSIEKIIEQQSGSLDLDLLKLTWSAFIELK
tara:strand:- start:9189 stop:10535 length:1347 start_codon:yes stop_codon:yes gene_type:complete